MRKKLFSLLLLVSVVPMAVHADEFSQLQQQLIFLIQQVTRLQSELSTLQRISSIDCKTLDRNLGLNDKGEDVRFLQSSLEREGFNVGDEKNKSTYGELT